MHLKNISKLFRFLRGLQLGVLNLYIEMKDRPSLPVSRFPLSIYPVYAFTSQKKKIII